MLKTLGVIVGGIFVGAVAVEVLRAKCPNKLDTLYTKVSDLATGIKEGFREGYRSTSKSSESAEVEVEVAS